MVRLRLEFCPQAQRGSADGDGEPSVWQRFQILKGERWTLNACERSWESVKWHKICKFVRITVERLQISGRFSSARTVMLVKRKRRIWRVSFDGLGRNKNFKKITSCVHSKHKDQVRHYYYWLVRRMNNVGPKLSLDARTFSRGCRRPAWMIIEPTSSQDLRAYAKFATRDKLVSESERLRLGKLEEVSKNLEPKSIT
ncbi:TSL-kinase interacting protein 1 [Striga asiatica]|uniref:TSL-kinase interacting protein 1 n=1 Tax=Striga asiatica TaxID=4170 RepID=A0A5A7P3F3_STRAF|nr:TSL-kinase interacting protein 1 [Striga asiatica]